MVNHLPWVIYKEVSLLKVKLPNAYLNDHFNRQGKHSEAYDINILQGEMSAPAL